MINICFLFYRALCANRDSTNDEVKVNYRKMALLVHPDKCVDPQADEAFKGKADVKSGLQF